MAKSNDGLILAGITVVVLLSLTGGAVVAYKATRGLRNNNPGNIRRTKTVWQGMAADQSSDKEFVVFTSAEYGIRALARVLKTGLSQGENTIRKIITAWAPPTENNTASYINAVAKSVGISADATVDFSKHLTPLVEAIISHENGFQPYESAIIARGISLA